MLEGKRSWSSAVCKNRRNRWGTIAYNKSSLHASREEKAIRGNSGCGGGERGGGVGGTRTVHAFEPQVFHACLILLLHLIGREGACGFYRPITELSKKKIINGSLGFLSTLNSPIFARRLQIAQILTCWPSGAMSCNLGIVLKIVDHAPPTFTPKSRISIHRDTLFKILKNEMSYPVEDSRLLKIYTIRRYKYHSARYFS